MFNTNAVDVYVTVIPYSDDDTEITTNGTFEDWTGGNPDSWSKGTNVTLTEDTGRIGGSSVKMTATSSSDKQFYQDETVVAEKWHRFNFYYKNTAGDTIDYFVYDNSNAAYIISETILSDSTDWSDEQIVTFKTPVACTSVRIGFSPTNDTDIVWVDDVTLVQEVETTYYTLVDGDNRYNQLWADYDNYRTGNHTVILDMEALTGETLKCGVVESGLANAFNDPRKGLSEGLKDFSVVDEFKYGGVYVNLRDIVRTFNGVLDVRRDSEFITFMQSIIKLNGSFPLSIYLNDNGSPTQWALYGRFLTMPVANFESYSYNSINFSIEEVV